MEGQNMVSWSDYEGIDGFGSTSGQQLGDLTKALNVGQEINAPGAVVAGDGFALRVESLERTLRSTTYRMDHIRLWKQVSKLAAFNTVEEHGMLDSFGENPDGAWMDEGDLPEEESSTVRREYSVVKYIGTTRSVSHVSTMIKPAYGSVLSQETVNGTMHLLRVIERALFYARSDLSALQFDGFEKLLEDNLPATHKIDLRGAPLSEDVLIDAGLTVSDAPTYGRMTDLYCTPKVHADLVKTFFPKERYDLFTKRSDGMIGLDISGFTSPSGPVRFQPDVFITDGGAPNAAALGDAAKIPSAPTVSSAPTTPVEATAQFTADDAGDYFYFVVAANRYGKAAAIDLVAGPTAVTVAAGDKVTFGLTPGAVQPDWWEIYRTAKDGAAGSERLILRIPHTAGAGEETIDDLNAVLPYTSSAFGFQMNTEAMSVKQLAPMLKIPLATIDTSIRWAQVCYLVPVIYSNKHILFQNVGRAPGFVGAP